MSCHHSHTRELSRAPPLRPWTPRNKCASKGNESRTRRQISFGIGFEMAFTIYARVTASLEIRKGSRGSFALRDSCRLQTGTTAGDRSAKQMSPVPDPSSGDEWFQIGTTVSREISRLLVFLSAVGRSGGIGGHRPAGDGPLGKRRIRCGFTHLSLQQLSLQQAGLTTRRLPVSRPYGQRARSQARAPDAQLADRWW